jgi:hypothetical protein
VGCNPFLAGIHAVISSSPQLGLALIWEVGIQNSAKVMPRKVLFVSEKLGLLSRFSFSSQVGLLLTSFPYTSCCGTAMQI